MKRFRLDKLMLDEKLHLCYKVDDKINTLKQEKEIIEKEYSIKGIYYNKPIIQKTNVSSGIEDYCIKKERDIKNIDEDIKNLEIFKLKAELLKNKIKLEGEELYEIFKLRFEDNKTYVFIENKVALCRQTINNRIKHIKEIAELTLN